MVATRQPALLPDHDSDAATKRAAPEAAPIVPLGRRTNRLARLERDHPRLYAMRHVVLAVGEVLLGVLGIGVVLGRLLPALGIGMPDLPDLPGLPGWIRAVFGWYDDLTSVPIGWIRSAYEWTESRIALPGWATTLVRSWKWWGPILIALVVALTELDRRRRKDRTETGGDDR